jgi:undecaprenyl-diphosphatase
MYLWGGEFTNGIMKAISFIGEYGAIFLLIGFTLALFKRTRKVGGTIILSIAIGYVISNIVLKNAIQRLRPFQASSEFELWWAGSNGKVESGYSFPSGHVTAAMAFSMAVMLTTNKKYNWPIMFLPLIMASSRIYLMVHYFSDCVGGFAVGLVSGVIAYIIFTWIYKSKIKLFVWLRELDLFNHKPQKSKPSKEVKRVSKPVEIQEIKQPEVYIPQSEESESPTFIRQITQEVDQEESESTSNR